MSKESSLADRGWHFRLATAGAALTADVAMRWRRLGTTTTAASAAPAKYTFVLIPGTVIDPFYITMGIGAKAEAAKLGVSLTFKGTTTWNPTQQVPIVNATLATQPERSSYRAVRRRGPLQADRCLREGRHPGRQR